MWIASAERIREIDRSATTEYGIPATVLMERAGLAVFDAVRQLLPEGGRITVLCGKGNNGGDGLVVARHAQASGYGVDCLVASTEAELSLDASMQLAVSRAQGVLVVFVDDARWARKIEMLGCRDLIVDALLGTGAKGELKDALLQAIRAINRSGTPVVAVDVPSGIDCDTGEDLGESVWALRTVTFGLPKPFLFQGIGVEHSGYWTVADIGFPTSLLAEPTDARLVDRDWVANLLPERLRAAHKGEHGKVLIVAGSRTMPGAAMLAARGALRAGAGLVMVASVPSVCDAAVAALPEIVVLPLVERDGAIAPQAAQALLDQSDRWDAALFGPGLTHGEGVMAFLRAVWTQWALPTCIDADALNAVAHGLSMPEAECLLTPHPGEMSRLMKASIAEVQTNRLGAVRVAAQQLGQTVLLKGAYSITGEASQPLAVNSTGNPGMATGGMGDVLGGVAVVMLAQQLRPYCAGACAAFWHGMAGDLCAEAMGPIGYRASEVADALPQARAKLTGSCSEDC